MIAGLGQVGRIGGDDAHDPAAGLHRQHHPPSGQGAADVLRFQQAENGLLIFQRKAMLPRAPEMCADHIFSLELLQKIACQLCLRTFRIGTAPCVGKVFHHHVIAVKRGIALQHDHKCVQLLRVLERFRRGILDDLHRALEEQRGNVTLTVKHGEAMDELIAVEAGDTSGECFGIAFDIGTTTVVGMLWDLAAGELVDVEARTNYQSLFGADVISRIQYSMEGEGKLKALQEKVIGCCNDILSEICERNAIEQKHIYDATMVGNTTMSHLVFGVTPASMARTPFAPVFAEAQDERADELGLSIYTHANVRLLPNIAGHVGSDIVGMMMAAGLDRCKGAHIAIDIGTNGEVVAVKNGRMLCCSTAAGPAFEGATIQQGMRAAAGAIEGVVIDGSVHLKTIDDAPTIGICGSGLIDAVSELLRVGVVDVSGRMLTKAQAQSAGVPSTIADCIVGEGADAYFLLSEAEDREPIILTQSDIREVQLAKGAILAGIQTLMAELQMSVDEIESIMLAGAFGNYINKRSALGIGLLPQVKEEKILAIGNAAGVGACMALLSDAERGRADLLALSTEHIELSMNPTFQDYYIDAMTFRK